MFADRRWNFRRWWLPAMAVALLAGCQKERPKTIVEEAPYSLLENGRLRVRADLMKLLKFKKVELQEVRAEVAGLGQLAFAPGASYALRAPFDGFVQTVHVDVGQVIDEKYLLAVIRSGELAKIRSEVKRVTAELESEYDALERAKVLVKEEAITNRRVIEIKARVGSLEAQRNGLIQSLSAAQTSEEGNDLFELRAPKGGHILQRKLDPGELVRDPDNEPAFLIGDPTKLIVRANFPERDAPLLREGFACTVSVPSLGNRTLAGELSSVVKAIDPTTRTVQAICKLVKPDERLRADMLARVTVTVIDKPRLLVPRSAVLLRRDTSVVLVKCGDQELERRTVVTGTTIGDRLEVVSGLLENEEVVVEGAVLLDGELDQLL